MEQTDYTCKDCVLFNDEDPGYPYCMGKHLYTYVNPDDDACGDIIPLAYTCKDCFFYLNETCKHSDEYRTTTEENEACVNFEWVSIKI